MASILLPRDAAPEAYVHCCSASQLQELLTHTPTEWFRTHGHFAVVRAMKFNNDPLPIMRVLLEQPGIRVNLPEFDGEEGNTPLHVAVLMHSEENCTGSLKLLLERPDLDPNKGNRIGECPLHCAARVSSVPCVEILLDDPRVNVAAVNYNKQTCLHIACEASSKETSDQITREIMKRTTSNTPDSQIESHKLKFLGKHDLFGNTGLHYAASRGLQDVVKTFLEAERLGNKHELSVKKNLHNNLAIHLAAKNGHHEVVETMLQFLVDNRVDDSHVENIVVNIKDHDGFGLLHHVVRSGCKDPKILQSCIHHLRKSTKLTFDLYVELLAEARDKTIADFLLQSLKDDDIVKNSEGEEDDPQAKLLHVAVSKEHVILVMLIVKWYPKQAVAAWREAKKQGNETILAVVMDHPKVLKHIADKHRAYTGQVTAANAILVVSVLIIALTFGHCFTSVEAAQRRKDISELKGYGGPPTTMKVHWIDFIILPRVAFLQAMAATILAAFAALPFSFAFFLHEAVDDVQVEGLVATTKVLIVSASYFLVLSFEAIFFSFVRAQFIAPYINYECAFACEVAAGVFLLCAMLFLGFNFIYYWTHRKKGDKQRVITFKEMLKIIIITR